MKEAAKILYSKKSDLEILLDSCLVDFQSLHSQIQGLVRKLETAEQMVNLRLDTSRNELLVASTVLSVFACTIGFAGFITGAFGMNLDNAPEFTPIPGLFYVVVFLCLCFITFCTYGVLRWFKNRGILPTHARLSPSIISGNYLPQNIPFLRKEKSKTL